MWSLWKWWQRTQTLSWIVHLRVSNNVLILNNFDTSRLTGVWNLHPWSIKVRYVNCRLFRVCVSPLTQQHLWISGLSRSAHNGTINVIGKGFKGSMCFQTGSYSVTFSPLSEFVLYYRKFINSKKKSKPSTVTIPSLLRIKSQQTAVVDSWPSFYPTAAAADLEKVSLFQGPTRSSWVPSCVHSCFPALRSIFCATEIRVQKLSFSRIFPHFYSDVTITHGLCWIQYIHHKNMLISFQW